MQSQKAKLKIVKEAFRLLAPGGRYWIHETCLNENLSSQVKSEMEKELAVSLRVGARPLSIADIKR